jgi:hypothetical protein
MVDELRLRNLSEVTVRLYIGSVERFARYFGKSREQLGPEQIREFLLHLICDRKGTSSTRTSRLRACQRVSLASTSICGVHGVR